MIKSRKFRPTIGEMQLEERVVLSVTAHVATSAALNAPKTLPVATSAGVTATLNQIHSALLSYQSTVKSALLYAQAQVVAGHVTQAQAITLLEGYIGNKTSQLFYSVRGATGNLPYGRGFNGYILSPTSPVGDLPSGAKSLYSLLTFPTQTTTGPIGALQGSVFLPISGGNFGGAFAAVSDAAIHSTYAQVKVIVSQYVVNGVKAHDFAYHA